MTVDEAITADFPTLWMAYTAARIACERKDTPEHREAVALALAAFDEAFDMRHDCK